VFAEILSVLIFVVMFFLIITDKIERHIVTLVSGLVVIVFVFGVGMHSLDAVISTINVRSIFTEGFWYQASENGEASMGINWSTIIFITGMMIMVEGMGNAGFFRWLCLGIAKIVKYKAVSIFITFMIMSGILSMFIDSITVILFLAAVTVELSKLLKFNPVPMIISEIFCANLGGSATMCGDPPNIIIGTSLGFTFSDFICNTGVLALVSLIVSVVYFYICFSGELRASEKLRGNDVVYPDPAAAITDKKSFLCSSIIFALAVILLVTHAQSGLTVAFIGVLISAITLVTSGKDALKLLKKVDYKTLLFFVGLFVVVGGLEKTGILDVLADLIARASGGNMKLIIAIIIWISAVASAFIDNIPFAATMTPVISELARTQGVDISVLAWALSMGTDIGGSATPIGASANVVGTSVSAKNGHPISWAAYCRYSTPATILVVLICMLGIFFRY
jgi:Na+/H+ antiporter NhaD/arsenite permease-like protein